MLLQPGSTLFNGKYRVEAFIGQGASAEVYRAQHLALKLPRALKVLRKGEYGVGSSDYADYRQRFQLEAQLGAKIINPHVVQVHDFDEEDGLLVLAMEYAAGGSVNDRITYWRERNQPMPIGEAVGILIDAANGVAAVHAQDAVHRDLKPTNILFDAKGHTKIADLGLAQVPGGPSMRSRLSTTIPHPGTPAYMSPEQERSSAYLTPASDVYSLGLISFELLTGRAYKNVRPGTRPSALRQDVPPALDELVARMLDEDARKRPFNGDELLAALNDLGVAPQWIFVEPPKLALSMESVEQPLDAIKSTKTTTPEPSKDTLAPVAERKPRANRAVAAAALFGLILAGVIGVVLLANSGAFRAASPAPTETATTSNPTLEPTATPRPAEKPVATSSPTEEPTPMPTPTSKSAPTLTPAPTAPDTPTPAQPVTPRPTRTALADLFPPNLLEPTNGAAFSASDQPTFSWSASGTLAEDEFYVLAISHAQGVDEQWLKGTTAGARDYLINLQPGDGFFRWNVSVRKRTGTAPNGGPTGTVIFQSPETRVFTWTASRPYGSSMSVPALLSGVSPLGASDPRVRLLSVLSGSLLILVLIVVRGSRPRPRIRRANMHRWANGKTGTRLARLMLTDSRLP